MLDTVETGGFQTNKQVNTVLDKLTTEVRSILNLPDVRAALEKTGLDVRPSTPEEMRAVMQREFTEYGEIIRRNNIKAQ